jgi:hypothetical protein
MARVMGDFRRRIPMNSPTTQYEPAPVLGPNDPPPDFSRETAAYAKEEERLVRDYLGCWALVVGDEVIGVFRTVGEACRESFRRFGDVKIMVKEIRDPNEPPDFMPLIDINHPSVRRLD